MHPLPQHMVWMGLGIAIAEHYMKLLLTFGMFVIEGAPISMEHPSSLGRSVGCQLLHILVQSGDSSWQAPTMI